MHMMKVKLIGKADISTEYNGIKYTFTIKNRIKEVPVEVYNFIQQSGDVFSADIVPYFGEEEVKQEVKIEAPTEKKIEVKEKLDEKPKRGKVRRPLRPNKNRK